MATAVGIDLGTSRSAIATLMPAGVVVIPNAEGSLTTPSVVGFDADGRVVVGDSAHRQAVTNVDRTVRSAKRSMGNRLRTVGGEVWSQEISAHILRKLKRDAESFLDDVITQAVVTVPAHFNDTQRTATKQAAEIAGLEVLRVINEPTAAALAYGLQREDDEVVLVFDLGGGSFDVSILEIGDGVFDVKSTAGDLELGGDDWDRAIVEWLVDEAKTKHGLYLSAEGAALERLRQAAEQAKKDLSTRRSIEVRVPYLAEVVGRPVHLECHLERTTFEDLTEGLVERCRVVMQRALDDAGLKPNEIDHTIMVGGASRLPAIQSMVAEHMGQRPSRRVNPDEVVAVGAAIQAGVLKGVVSDVLLLDVIPLSLGIENRDRVMHKLLERNTMIPTRRTEVFTTGDDNQPRIDIHVLAGERELAAYNTTIGSFHLADLPAVPRGVPQIEVTFDVDANSIVHVSAKDLATDKEQSVTIAGQSTLSAIDLRLLAKGVENQSIDHQISAGRSAPSANAIDGAAEVAYLPVQYSSEPAEDEKAAEGRESESADETSGESVGGQSGYVFVSYSRHDQKYVNRLAKYLAKADLDIWIDERIEHGSHWTKVLQEKVDSCAALIVVMTPASDDSIWVQNELDRARTKSKPVLPLLLDGEGFFALSHIHHENVTSGKMPGRSFVDRLRELMPAQVNGDPPRQP